MTEHTIISAINQALRDAMTLNDNIIIMGQDVGMNGGVFRATDGLWNTFGPQRVIDMPLAENLMADMPIGMATHGLIPIMEFQFSGFMYPVIESIINHASRMPQRTQERLHCPIVFRAPFGGGVRAPEHHCETPESLLASIPNCEIMVPSCPNKAYQLMHHAIQSQSPSVFLEPKRIYRSVKAPLDNQYHINPHQANLITEGSDLTIISWGSMLYDCLTAAQESQLSIEIIDLTYLRPIDWHLCVHSANKTRNVLIVQEGHLTCSIASELSAGIHEYCFHRLLQPVQRIGAPNLPRPSYQYESQYMPTVANISQKIHQMSGAFV